MSDATLNAGQRAAVECESALVVVSAGAGSGKTLVLAERFCDRIGELDASGATNPMDSVLLITFTEKAAGELVDRVRKVLLSRGRRDLARQVDQAWISTIHGFCARIARRHAIELGIDPAFTVIADPEVSLMRRRAFEDAAVAAAMGDAGTERLIEEHGVESVREAVMATYDTLRSRGVSVDALTPQPLPRSPIDIRALRRDLSGLMADYRSLGSGVTIQKNLDGYGNCLALVDALQAGTRAADPELLLELAGCLGARYGNDAVKTATAHMNDLVVGLARDVVSKLAAEQADALAALCEAYADRYEVLKAASGSVDFEDLQLLTRRLWTESPDTARRYARQFIEVLVDEFQDTTALQLQAIEPVANRRLCLVGDVQQSIYRFRDADVGVFLAQRKAAAAGGGQHDLTVNYRSHPRLLSALNDLFSAPVLSGEGLLRLEPGGEGKDAIAWPSGEPRVEFLLTDRSMYGPGTWRQAEAEMLAARIRRIVDEGVARPGDIAVLVRSTKTATPYLEALARHGLDVSTSDATGFFQAPEVASVRWLLRVLANPLDDEAVAGLLAGTFGGLGDGAIGLLASPRTGMWEALGHGEVLGLSPNACRRAAYVRGAVEELRSRLARIRLADALLDAAEALGVESTPERANAAWSNIRKAARITAQYEARRPADPRSLLRYLDEREAYVRREPAANAAAEGPQTIRVMTVHAAKGLEFPIVAVADLGHGAAPASSRFLLGEVSGGPVLTVRPAVCGSQKKVPDPEAWERARDLDQELESAEAKRVLYVACTRAEQVLLLSGAADLDKSPSGDVAVDWIRTALDRPGGVPDVVTRLAGDAALAASEMAPPSAPAARACVRPTQGLRANPDEPLPRVREFSYTTLSLYERCAYRFYAQVMLGVPGIVAREKDDPRAVGAALHGALETLAAGRPVDEERLRALAASERLGPAGLERIKAAVAAIRSSPLMPLLDPGEAEVPFAVALSGDAVLRGTLDLLVRDGPAALVLDYKTGDMAGREGEHRRQAEVYSLALLRSGFEAVEVRFVAVEQGCAASSFLFGVKDAGALEERIEGVVARIGSQAFERRAHYDASVCPDCPVSGTLCPIVHPRGSGAGRGRRTREA
jgi:ATP-dependent exoDNAse (exonuclease V) beta subunit